MGIPTLLLEQNAIIGTTNRLFARFADRLLLGMPLTTNPFCARSQLVGNPLRGKLVAAATTRALDPPSKPVLLVIGGSQGSAMDQSNHHGQSSASPGARARFTDHPSDGQSGLCER